MDTVAYQHIYIYVCIYIYICIYIYMHIYIYKTWIINHEVIGRRFGGQMIPCFHRARWNPLWVRTWVFVAAGNIFAIPATFSVDSPSTGFMVPKNHSPMGVSENVVYPFLPNGFADHYPDFKWLFHWEYTLFSDKPL